MNDEWSRPMWVSEDGGETTRRAQPSNRRLRGTPPPRRGTVLAEIRCPAVSDRLRRGWLAARVTGDPERWSTWRLEGPTGGTVPLVTDEDAVPKVDESADPEAIAAAVRDVTRRRFGIDCRCGVRHVIDTDRLRAALLAVPRTRSRGTPLALELGPLAPDGSTS